MIDDIDLAIFGAAVTAWATVEGLYYEHGITLRAAREAWTAEEVARARARTHKLELKGLTP